MKEINLETFMPIKRENGILKLGIYQNPETRQLEFYKMEKAVIEDVQELFRNGFEVPKVIEG